MFVDEIEVRRVYQQAIRAYYHGFPRITTVDGAEIPFVEDHKVNKNIIEGVRVSHLASLSRKYPGKTPILPCLFRHGGMYVHLMEEYVMPIEYKGNTVLITQDEDCYKVYYTNLHQLCSFFSILFSYNITSLQPVNIYKDLDALEFRVQKMREWGIYADKYNIQKYPIGGDVR